MPPPSAEEILEKRLAAEADRAAMPVEEFRRQMLTAGLDAARQERAARERAVEAAKLTVDVLLVTATMTEHRELRDAALAAGLSFETRRGRQRPYYHLGVLGSDRVASMQVEMGAFGAKGSAASCIHARAETQATTIILLGTAFGVDPAQQRVGDVLVSESVFLYEDRHVIDHATLDAGQKCSASVGGLLKKVGVGQSAAARLLTEHSRPRYHTNFPSARRAASAAWVRRFRGLAEEFARTGESERIIVGTLLSGGTRIESGRFRDELVGTIPKMDPPIVGGEMEAAGVVASAYPASIDEPGWIVVKGIADFADASSRADIAARRGPAARSSARAVLCALQSPTLSI